jgi:hypothetical protein
MFAEIVTAYSYSTKYKTYRVAAYVLESDHAGLPRGHTFKVLLSYDMDEDLDVATRRAIAKVYDGNVRHPSKMTVTSRGRLSQERIKGWSF